MDFFRKLLESDFMPHGHCYFWKPEILWVTVGGDALTGLAYFSIPLMLIYFARSRQDLAHKHVFFLFGAFIMLCGATHFMDIWTAWVPTYRLAAIIKLVTGLVSVATAVVLYKSIPALLAIPSNAQLELANQQLKEEILERKKIESELHLAKTELEARVQERTRELMEANKKLEEEVEQRTKAQQALQETNHNLKQINTDLDTFVYSASHDLKAPIANMEGLLIALHEEMEAENGSVGPILEQLETSVHKLNRTINDLSDVSKIQRRTEENILEEISFETALDEVITGIKHLVEQSGVQIAYDFSRQPSVWFVPQLLQSILQNLLTNAIKYSSPDRQPLIKLYSSETDDYVILTVEDNGIGMNLEKYGHKMFSLFKRMHDHVEGSGVGLYVIKRIVDNYKGKIEVESAEDKGTVFHIQFKK